MVGGVSYLGPQNTKKCTINEMHMIGFEKTLRPFGFDDVLDQGLCGVQGVDARKERIR